MPPIAQYKTFKIHDTWSIRNESESQPLLVASLTAKTWTDDASGNPQFVDVDPSRILVRLSRNSARLTPKSTEDFSADVQCLDKRPCWVVVYALLSLGRVSGVGVQEMLPHVIYLSVKPIQKTEVTTEFASETSFTVLNSGPNFERPIADIWTTTGKQSFGFPVFPESRRTVTVDSTITKISVRFEKFKINVAH
jgi:hypothetical protein